MNPQNQERLLAELLDHDEKSGGVEAERAADISYPPSHVVVEMAPPTTEQTAKLEN